MKKIIIIVFALLQGWVYAQSGTFTLKGKVGMLNAPAKAYLIYAVNDNRVLDSTLLVNGSFQFTGTITDPTRAALIVSHDGTTCAR